MPPHKVSEHVAFSVDDLRHPLFRLIELLDDKLRVRSAPMLSLSLRARVDNFQSLAVSNTIVCLIPLAQSLGVLGDRVPSSIRITAGVCREVVD